MLLKSRQNVSSCNVWVKIIPGEWSSMCQSHTQARDGNGTGFHPEKQGAWVSQLEESVVRHYTSWSGFGWYCSRYERPGKCCNTHFIYFLMWILTNVHTWENYSPINQISISPNVPFDTFSYFSSIYRQQPFYCLLPLINFAYFLTS